MVGSWRVGGIQLLCAKPLAPLLFAWPTFSAFIPGDGSSESEVDDEKDGCDSSCMPLSEVLGWASSEPRKVSLLQEDGDRSPVLPDKHNDIFWVVGGG